MLALTLAACTTWLHVEASSPQAEVGVVRAVSRPSTDALAAEHRGKGKLDVRVNYSVFDTWWAWARLPGQEPVLVEYPTQLAVGPTVSCAAGFLLLVPLIGCFWVSKPSQTPVFLQIEPAPAPPPAPPPAPVPPPAPPAVLVPVPVPLPEPVPAPAP